MQSFEKIVKPCSSLEEVDADFWEIQINIKSTSENLKKAKNALEKEPSIKNYLYKFIFLGKEGQDTIEYHNWDFLQDSNKLEEYKTRGLKFYIQISPNAQNFKMLKIWKGLQEAGVEIDYSDFPPEAQKIALKVGIFKTPFSYTSRKDQKHSSDTQVKEIQWDYGNSELKEIRISKVILGQLNHIEENEIPLELHHLLKTIAQFSSKKNSILIKIENILFDLYKEFYSIFKTNPENFQKDYSGKIIETLSRINELVQLILSRDFNEKQITEIFNLIVNSWEKHSEVGVKTQLENLQNEVNNYITSFSKEFSHLNNLTLSILKIFENYAEYEKIKAAIQTIKNEIEDFTEKDSVAYKRFLVKILQEILDVGPEIQKKHPQKILEILEQTAQLLEKGFSDPEAVQAYITFASQLEEFSWGKAIGGAMLAFAGVLLISAVITTAVLTFGTATPVSLLVAYFGMAGIISGLASIGLVGFFGAVGGIALVKHSLGQQKEFPQVQEFTHILEEKRNLNL